jgi:hypothetical protein
MDNTFDARSQRGSMLLAEIRKKYPNYHPVIAMVDIAHDQDASLELQYNCHKTVAKYIEPELKNVEVKQDLRTMTTVRVTMFDESEPVEFIETTMTSPAALPVTSDLLKDW